jgi:hypothetical protein
MIGILNNAQKYSMMTQAQKMRMSRLIRKNGGFPREYRNQLWTLASGAERSKRNHKGYYVIKGCTLCDSSENDEPELTECPN